MAKPMRLAVLDLDHPAGIEVQVARLVSAAAPEASMEVLMPVKGSGVECTGGITPQLISQLSRVFQVLSELGPRMLVVPLLPWAGWSLELMAGLDGVTEFLMPPLAEATSEALPWPMDAEQRLALLTQALGPAWEPAAAATEGSSGPGSTGCGTLPAPDMLQSRDVAMGGTFDRLHSGHMLLLVVAGLVAVRKLYVGITADALLVNKAHRELLQPYAERERAAAHYLQLVRPGLHVQTGALRDPKEPTAAELEAEMAAIVVSAETLAGARHINEGRQRRGFAALQVVSVPVVGAHRGDGQAKLSSSELRAADFAAF